MFYNFYLTKAVDEIKKLFSIYRHQSRPCQINYLPAHQERAETHSSRNRWTLEKNAANFSSAFDLKTATKLSTDSPSSNDMRAELEY